MASFYKCYFHVIWAVKYRAPLLTPPVESMMLAAIHKKCQTLKCHVFAANCALDHLHIALEIPPVYAPAEVIGTLKGSSSYQFNQMHLSDERFHWQDGYGLLTFGPQALEVVVAYVERQKQHHQLGDLILGMENCGEEA